MAADARRDYGMEKMKLMLRLLRLRGQPTRPLVSKETDEFRRVVDQVAQLSQVKQSSRSRT